MMTGVRRTAFAVILLVASQVLPAAPAAAADWLSRLFAEAVGGASSARRVLAGSAGLEAAARHLKALPPTVKGPALAAHVSDEGHWTFINKAGERFTAGTPDEMKRVETVLAPEAASSEAPLTVVLSEDAVFRRRTALKDLPRRARLMIGFEDEAYVLERTGTGADERMFAEVRPNLLIEIGDRLLFEEAAWQLARPLDRANIRVLALEPGGPQALPATPKFDVETKRALTDVIDPARLTGALASIARQTAVLSGRIEGEQIWFQPANGPQKSLVLKDIAAAAAAADVNLLLLQAATPRQPGGRNWLWQRVSVDGLDQALQRAHLADFLNALGLGQGRLMVSASRTGPLAGGQASRVALRIVPVKADGTPLSGLTDAFSDIVSDVAGRVVTTGIEAGMIGSDRQRELDRRIIPWLPSLVQLGYLACLLLGGIGWGPASRWWARIWPDETRDAYSGIGGLMAARVARSAAFVLVFVPLVAAAAAPRALIGWIRPSWLRKTPTPATRPPEDVAAGSSR